MAKAEDFGKVYGIEEMERNVEKLNTAMVAGQKEVTIEAAKELALDIKSRAAVDKGLMRDEIDAIVDDQTGEAFIKTGRAHHWVLLEFGTRFMAADPFIRPAIARMRKRLMVISERIMAKVFRSAL